MSEWVVIITSVLGVLGGGGAFVSFILYRKQQKRFKTAEAFEKEVNALRAAVATLEAAQGVYETQLTAQSIRIDEFQKTIANQDGQIRHIRNEKHTVEIKHAKNKTAINRAYECPFCEDKAACPVLKQRADNEEQYLREIQRDKKPE